ncbi:hypothetical protein [Leifsonia xyli]|uniref:hypothetical protein n=1 Tax=Leifsonia xyli TaxID=1575 RepID=UPI00114D27C1|nr:hypothetical protein [Leifsonia xyli]
MRNHILACEVVATVVLANLGVGGNAVAYADDSLTPGGVSVEPSSGVSPDKEVAARADVAIPYHVSVDGVTLTDGSTFPANGDVNYRTTSRSSGMHFDPNNNQRGAAFIGKTFLPIKLAPGECIVWVQYSNTNYHYGEGGNAPVCKPGSPSASTIATPKVATVTAHKVLYPIGSHRGLGRMLPSTGLGSMFPMAGFAFLLVILGVLLLLLGFLRARPQFRSRTQIS